MTGLATGEEKQLTQNSEGFLKYYVYFIGNPYQGLGKASICLHPDSGTVFYIQGRQICKVGMDGQMTAYTSVTSDGKRLVVPTTDARALDGDKRLSGQLNYDIDKRVRRERLSSYLHVFDTETGAEIACEQVPGAWITHVQFSPSNNKQILYNNEWPINCGIRRMWLWDGNSHIRLRTAGKGKNKEDWTCHEIWERDGSAIVYHGSFYEDSINYIGRVNPDVSELLEIALPFEWSSYGHFATGLLDVLVSDGYYRATGEDTAKNGQWICRLDVDWESKTAEWTPLCRHGSTWKNQDANPHPIFDHASKTVYFNSDADGKLAIYSIEAKGERD